MINFIISNPHGPSWISIYSALLYMFITFSNNIVWKRHLCFETFILSSPSASMALTLVLAPLRQPAPAPATGPAVPARGAAGAPSARGAAVTGGFLAAWGHAARARRGRVVRLAETDPNSYVPILWP